MRRGKVIVACIILAVNLLLNAVLGMPRQELRLVFISAPEGVPEAEANYTAIYQAERMNAGVQDWRGVRLCSGRPVWKCTRFESEDQYEADLVAAIEAKAPFSATLARWAPGDNFIRAVLFALAAFPPLACLPILCDSWPVCLRAFGVHVLRTAAYISIVQPVQLGIMLAPFGLLSQYYLERAPYLWLAAPEITGVPMGNPVSIIPFLQVILSCASLVIVNSYAKTFLPQSRVITIREYMGFEGDEDQLWQRMDNLGAAESQVRPDHGNLPDTELAIMRS